MSIILLKPEGKCNVSLFFLLSDYYKVIECGFFNISSYCVGEIVNAFYVFKEWDRTDKREVGNKEKCSGTATRRKH